MRERNGICTVQGGSLDPGISFRRTGVAGLDPSAGLPSQDGAFGVAGGLAGPGWAAKSLVDQVLVRLALFG